MNWLLQTVVLLPAIVVFLLLQACYRRPEAVANAYLIGLCCALMSLWTPDGVVIALWCIVLLAVLRAATIRMFSSVLMGYSTVALYAGLTRFLWPDSWAVSAAEQAWQHALERTFCWNVMPVWMLIISGLCVLIGGISLVAHFGRYATANVRIQTFVLVLCPFWIFGLLSTVFCPADGNGLSVLFCITSIGLIGLYLSTYGMPKMPRRSSSFSSSRRRSYSRRSRRR